MSKVPIAAVMIDQDNRLCVFPDVRREDGFTHIYRDASGVSWNSEWRCLVSAIPNRLTHLEWFVSIRKAVKSEYGVELITTPLTQWENVSPELRADLEAENG